MTTHRLISVTAAVVAVVSIGVPARPASAREAMPRAAAHTFAVGSFAVRESHTLGRRPAVEPAYGWPVKPFDRQHPIRAFLDDPRIGHEGGTAFHFGIDIAAPDGTRVYAVRAGMLYLSHGSLSVVSGPQREFGYWHIRAAADLKEHQVVHLHQLLGTIAPGWGHVHFAERLREQYVNPLRPGALGPYTDPIAPTVASVALARTASGFQLIAHAYDTTWPAVPGRWANEPVTPAVLRWRIGTNGVWHTAADFSRRMLDRSRFASVFAPETTQNHEGRPGTFAFFLTRAWRPADGTYHIEVEASDTRGNHGVGAVDIAVFHGEVQR